MKKYEKHLGLRIDLETHRKLHFIAEYESRSLNSEVLHLLRRYIREFEKEYGAIEIPNQTSTKKN
ncbi:MAG: toxin-antitoxin system HicB family antitoxin [Lachnospiraceae bacterium]